MKFCVPLLLLLLFDTLQGSTLPHVRKVRALNTTLQTNFNGTYERRNPCTNAEIESSSYIASHEFHHHTNEDNWSDYTHKCSAIISGFLQAIGNLVRFNNKQNGLFNFHINTSISQKQVGHQEAGKCCESLPTILVEATDCEVTPRKHKNIAKEAEEKTVTEGKYDGPVCLLNRRNKADPRTVSGTASCEQNAKKINPPIINSNQKISQKECHETEESLKEVWNPIKTSLGDTNDLSKVESSSQTVPNGNAERTKTTYEQISTEFETPATPLPESELQVIPVTISYESSQPKFGLENSPGFQATAFENANEQRNLNPPAATPNMPYPAQPSFNGFGTPPQSVNSLGNEGLIIQNQFPPALSNEQGLPAVNPQQPSNGNLDGQVPGPLLREPLPNFYPNQMPVFLPQSQTKGNPQGGPGYPQYSPTFKPTYNNQNPKLEFSGNYPPPSEQAPAMKSSFELPPPDYNNNPSEVGIPKTQAPGQISDMTRTVENNFTPDQQQTITSKKIETVYYNDGPTNYNQVPTAPLPEIQPEFLPTKSLLLPSESQQKLPDYPSEIARNEQPPTKSIEVLPPDSVGPKDAAFSDSPVIPNGGVGATFNLPVANSFQPVIPPNAQPPIAPALIAPQDKPLEQQSMIPPPVESKGISVQYQKVGIPEFQIPPNRIPGPSEISDNPPNDSFSNQPAPNTFIQPVPVDNISPSNDFSEQSTDKSDTLQQPNSTGLTPIENTPPQPIPTSRPQPSPGFTGPLSKNNMFGAVSQNFQKIVPFDGVPLRSPPVVAPTSDIISQTPVGDSQFAYPTPIGKPEPSVSSLIPNNIGNQLNELTAYNKPGLNSNDFQPERQSFFTEPSDRNLDYTTQTPFYNSMSAVYKSEPESQPGLISNVQNLSAPAPEQAFSPSGLERFPTTTLRPDLFPPSTPDVITDSYSEQTRPEFDSASMNPEFANPPRNGFQIAASRPGPQFKLSAMQQAFGGNRYTFAKQQPNPIPEISNPLNTNQPPLENNPVIPQQQRPQFYSNQNGDIQQSLPETALTSQTSTQTPIRQEYKTTGPVINKFPNAVPPQDQPITAVYSRPSIQPGIQNYEVQPGNQPPNAPAYYPEGRVSDKFYPEPPRNENQSFQATLQSVLPYQPQSVQIPSAESQRQFINPETTPAESTSNTLSEANKVRMTEYQSNIPRAAGPGANESFPKEYPPVEQQSRGFDGFQMSQQNYPNTGFPSREVPPVDLRATQGPVPQSFSGQSDSNLNYDGVQPNGILQPEPRISGNGQFSLQTTSNLQPNALPPKTGPMNSQNGVNPNDPRTFVPSASPQKTGVAPFPLPPLQTVPENFQVNNFPQGSAFGSTVSARSDVLAKGMDNSMLNPDQPSRVGQPESQDPNTNDHFPPAAPPRFTTQSSGEAITDYPYQPQPSKDYFSGVPGVQTTNHMLTSIDEYQSPASTTQEPLNYFQERPDDVVQTTPPPFQADQFLTSSQSQSEYVQNNAAMYSLNLAPRPKPQPSFDNLTEFPGDKTAGSTTQTPLPSEIKPETFGSQPQRQSALTETNIPDTDNAKALDTQPKSGSLDYLGPQFYPNFDVPAPAVNYPRQDRRSFPPTADSITRDTTYQTNSSFTPSQTVTTFRINPIEMVFNSNSSYFSTAMTPSEGLEMQPFRQAPALIASPQPQSTTVKYNEQIIIPQYQMPSASNPQPQATLKYANQLSGDNTREGLLDTVAETLPGPQEVMGTTLPPHYQTTPLRSQFPPSNMEFNNENTGRSFHPAQKQLVPVTQSSVTPTPSFEQQYSHGKTVTNIVEETVTTDFPTEVAFSSVEDQLLYADKLLNSSIPIHEYDQRMRQKPQRQRQQTHFSPTKTREILTESFTTPSTPFQHPMEIQNQPQKQSSLKNSEEIETYSPVGRPSPLEKEIKVWPQPRLQPFSSINAREGTADSPVTSSTPFSKPTDVQPQTHNQPFSTTISREIVTDSLVSQPPSFKPQIKNQPQPQLHPFPSINTRQSIADSSITVSPLFQKQTDDLSQTQLQSFSSTASKEIVGGPLVRPPPVFQPQTEVQPQPQVQSFPSANINEVMTPSPVTPTSPFAQQIVVEPQNQLQYPTTTPREDITVPPVIPPPSFQLQTDVQPQSQLQSISSTILREITADSPVTPPPPSPQQIDVQPQTQIQPISSIESREIVTDPLVSQPPTFQSQIEDQPQPQLEELDSTNIREVVTDLPLITPNPVPQQTDVQTQTELQPFSSTISEEVITDSLVHPPPAFHPQTEVQPQPLLQSFPSANIKEVMTPSPVTPTSPFPQQIVVEPQNQLQYPKTTPREDITAPPVTPPSAFQQQTNVQTQTKIQPFSSTISREILTDSLVSQPPLFQSQIEDQPQSQLQSLPSRNIRVMTDESPVIQPPPFQQQTEVQTQTEIQPFSSTISREIVTDSLVSPPSAFQPQIEDQPQLQHEKLDLTNIREDIAVRPVTPKPLFQRQTDVQTQTQFQPFSSTISREIITDSLVRPPSTFQPQTEVQPQSQLQSISSTIMREITADSLVTPPPPSPQQIDVQPQTQIQPLSSTISREIISDSLVSQPPTFQSQNEDQPQPQLEELDSTNIREVVTPLITPSPVPQRTDVQTQTELQPFSSTISREIVLDSLESQPPPFQQQTEVQLIPQIQSFPSTIIREIKTNSPVIQAPPSSQQIDVKPQTQLQSFSSTISKETVTDSVMSQPTPVEQQIKIQSRPQLEEFYTTNTREDVTASPVTPPPSFQLQTDMQSQAELQYPFTVMREDITATRINSPPPLQQQTDVQPQPQLQSFPSTNIRVVTTDSLMPAPPFKQQIEVQPQTELQPFSSTISEEVITDSLVSQPPPFQQETEVQPQPPLHIIPSTNTREGTADSPVTVSPLFQQQTDDLSQTQLQSFSSTTSKEIVGDPLVRPQPVFQPQTEVQPQPLLQSFPLTNMENIKSDARVGQQLPIQQQLESEPQPNLQSFSSRSSSAALTDIHINPPIILQQDVEPQRQGYLQNFSSRNPTEIVSDSPVSASASLQGAREQVQNQLRTFSARNSTEVAADSLVNPAAKLEKHVAQEFQTQRTRYTTTNTKEVITESFLPTSQSTYIESGKDGQLKSVEIRSNSEGNPSHGKRTTEVVEETIATDFPVATEFSSLEDEFILADKLLNNSTPVLKTTSFITVSPPGKNTYEEMVTTAVGIQNPADQTSFNTTSENAAVPLSKSNRVNYDQALPTQASREFDEFVVASNLNRADRQSISKSDLRPTYGPQYSQSGPGNMPTTVSPLESDQTVSSDFQTSERKVLFTPTEVPDHQESSNLNPLLLTLETHLNFPLHEPPEPSSSKPGPRRASPLPLLSQSYNQLTPTFPTKTGKRNSGEYLVKFKNSEKAAQETESAPRPDPPVPVSSSTDPSNGPEPLKVLENSSLDKMVPGSSSENF